MIAEPPEDETDILVEFWRPSWPRMRNENE